MKCFYHRNEDAVATCKACGRGICGDCCVNVGKGEACRDRCEEDARLVANLIDRNVKFSSTKNVRTGSLVSGGFFFFLGILFFGVAFTRNPEPDFLTLAMGALFVSMGIWFVGRTYYLTKK